MTIKLTTFAMKRSGQHAIINWLLTANQPSAFYNDQNSTAEIYQNNQRTIKQHIQPANYNLVIYSIEDLQIFETNHRSIVIIRDPNNWLASRIKTKIRTHKIPYWLNHAKSDLYKIIFDKWFQSKEYRQQICKDLNLNFSDQALNEVYGEGKSSYDGYEYNNRAQDMNVLHRPMDSIIMRQVRTNEQVKEAWNKLIN